jgi:hypothetical protein
VISVGGMDTPKKAVFFGELLMRLATKRHERFVQAHEFEVGYTGAEANAAVSLTHFGCDAYVVSVVPDTEIGQACAKRGERPLVQRRRSGGNRASDSSAKFGRSRTIATSLYFRGETYPQGCAGRG